MKNYLINLVITIILIASSEASNRLWYDKAAEGWTWALPIGSGRMGAMIYGAVVDEHIQFNEDTLWRGKPHDYARADAFQSLAQIRQLIFNGNAAQALSIVNSKFLSNQGEQSYQPFGDLMLHFAGHNNFTNYKRDLDMDSAIASVSY